MTPTDHILLLAVCATAPRLCLGCARLYIETGVSEAANGHRSRARICVALYPHQFPGLHTVIRCGQCMKDCHRKHDIGYQQFHIIYSAFGK